MLERVLWPKLSKQLLKDFQINIFIIKRHDNTALVLTELVLESGISDDTELCFLGREAQ